VFDFGHAIKVPNDLRWDWPWPAGDRLLSRRSHKRGTTDGILAIIPVFLLLGIGLFGSTL